MNFLSDLLGSTVALTDSSSNPSLQAQYTYEPFGNTTAGGTSNLNPYQFTGRELDSTDGLYYLRGRYYSPTLKRFISPDPLGFGGGDPNLYRYVGNDPVDLTDPLGLAEGGGDEGGASGGVNPIGIDISLPVGFLLAPDTFTFGGGGGGPNTFRGGPNLEGPPMAGAPRFVQMSQTGMQPTGHARAAAAFAWRPPREAWPQPCGRALRAQR
jgi:RHS repeat-associated protein